MSEYNHGVSQLAVSQRTQHAVSAASWVAAWRAEHPDAAVAEMLEGYASEALEMYNKERTNGERLMGMIEELVARCGDAEAALRDERARIRALVEAAESVAVHAVGEYKAGMVAVPGWVLYSLRDALAALDTPSGEGK